MNNTISLAASLAILLATVPAFAQSSGTGAVQPSNPPAPQQGMTTAAPGATTTTAGSPEATKPVGKPQSAANLNATDKAFVKKATLGGMAEIQAGQLAQNQAQSPDVKAFGQHMVADHTAAGQKLKSIVDAEGAQAPSDLDASDKKQLASLQKQNGKAFDRQYLKGQVSAHKDTVALFKKEAASGGDAQLKQFASDTLPTLQQHLTDVQALAKK
ncbi:MAG TPA: DUF4142 domain-containing protein [Aliidongia sp.]|uniref:DUF4142 domain-containing protein n=1 Tax=Aliidongia sp. TaxID=1914230 RepID=UPI002DDCBD34|nr:DUF4142 domain-containing protein [Aliidongia sp.]HEV2676143.1 DUF4142 domain-containing protein [Aliidongia sp.]